MKVFIAVVLAIGSVSALGSGPYLPSGWRPQGPSFLLPSEVSKPSDSPLKESLLQETEASGSDALREYGPPKVEEVVSVSQGLPDVSTEQAFFVQSLATQELQAGAGESVAVEASTDEAALLVEEVASTTEAQLAQVAVEEQATESLVETQPTFEVVADIVEQTSEAGQVEEATVAAVQEENVAPADAEEEIVAPTVVAQEEAVVVEEVVVPTVAVEDVVVEKVAEGVNNIEDALVKLENEVKAVEEPAVEIKAEVSGSPQQAPEGFLEYGPPGFREYGPPKAEDIARSAAVQDPRQVASTSASENNEVRRRRFSPKLKSVHKKH